MKCVLNIFIAAFAAVLLAVCSVAAFSASYIRTVDGANAPSAVASSYEFSYGCLIRTPIAAVCKQGKTYILDDGGNVYVYSEGGFSLPVEKIEKSEDTEYDKIAVFGDAIYIYGAQSVAAFADDKLYVVSPDSVSSYEIDGASTNDLVTPENGNKFVAGCAYKGTVYLIERSSSGIYSLWSYSGKKSKLANDLVCDGDIVCATATADGVFYSTLYSIYSAELSDSLGNTGGGIISLASDENALIYTLASGKVCRYENGGSENIVVASVKLSIASRRNVVAVADKGNNRLTVLDEGNRKEIDAVRPDAVAIGYTGKIYVSSDMFISGYDENLRQTDRFTIGSNTSAVIDLCVDRSVISEDILYALGSDGNVYASDRSDAVIGDVVALTAAPNGGFYALLSGGTAVYCASSSASAENVASVALSGAYDIATDRAGNIFRLTQDGIYINDETASPRYASGELVSINVGECVLDHGNMSGFGDIIAVSTNSPSTQIISGDNVGTDMKCGDSDKQIYSEFTAPYKEKTANKSDHKVDVRKTLVPAEVYPCPVEMPSLFKDASGKSTQAEEIPTGSYVIVLAQYPDTDYCYAITENPTCGQSVMGFVNVNALSEPLTYENTDAVKGYVRTAVTASKYPSNAAPVIDEFKLNLNSSYQVMPFIKGYSDSDGHSWYRIAYEYGGETYDCYVPDYCISLSGSGQGHNTDPDYNGEIKCKENETPCYEFIGGTYVANGAFVKNGQKIEIIGEFTKSREFTFIRYVDDNGETRECYVRTEVVRHTEAGVYQVVMFIVGIIVAAFVILLVVLKVKRKNKID